MKKIIFKSLLALCLLMQVCLCFSASIVLPTNLDYEEACRLFSYRNAVLQQKVPCSPSVLSNLWRRERIEHSSDSVFASIVSVVTEEMKNCHFNRMKRVLDQTPWKNTISDREFTQWILPYRTANEMIDFTGDSLLQFEYSPLIRDVKDPVEAFRIISKRVYDTMRECNSACPYTLDAYAINYIHQANCEQRCVLLVHILRQLGIPCSIDRIPFWGNYSTVGHSWVAMPYGGKIYIFEDTSTGGVIHESSDGFIDAALFPIRYQPTLKDYYPYPIQNRKEITKVYRSLNNEQQSNDSLFAYSGYEDVSSFYGLTTDITKRINSKLVEGSFCYLCAFRTGNNWEPIARAQINAEGVVSFNNANPHILYILAHQSDGKIEPLSNPFLGSSPEKEFEGKEFEEKITLNRKYPIFSHWTNQWGNMVGSTFEACMDSSSEHWDTLAVIESMPFGFTSVSFNGQNRKYRFIRYHASPNTRTPLAELELYFEGKKLNGSPISGGVLPGKEIAPFDGNTMSVCSTKQTGYWVGLAFDEPCFVDSIRFLPKNDGNNIQEGHRYELYYFNKGWKMLGSKIAISNQLKYYVPQGVLLLLKDKTKGVEERPFFYDSRNSIQLWY